MNFKKLFFQNYMGPIIVMILSPIVGIIYYQISIYNWYQVFKTVPFYIWIIVLLVIGLWIYIIHKFKENENSSQPYIGIVDYSKDITIFKGAYEDVLWEITSKEHNIITNETSYFLKNPSSIEIKMPPRCPECETKLKISKGLIRSEWKCWTCGFSKKSSTSMYEISSRYKLIVESEIEKKNDKGFKFS